MVKFLPTRRAPAPARPAPRDELQHTTWCGRGHHCNLAEHRSAAIVIDVPGRARATITRIRGRNGREHAEVRLTTALTTGDTERQLRDLCTGLARLAEDLANSGRRAA